MLLVTVDMLPCVSQWIADCQLPIADCRLPIFLFCVFEVIVSDKLAIGNRQ
jgi:hypothetical protein